MHESKTKRLVAFIAKDPNTGVQKLHLRVLWDHASDENFQLGVRQGLKKPVPENSPKWKHTSTGVTFNLQDLTMFLENEMGDLLVNTFLDDHLKADMIDFAEYISNKKPEAIEPLFEEYKNGNSNREITAVLKEFEKIS